VTFRYKDYRRPGQARYRTMTLSADEFIRRFLLHVLPKGFHRIRHYGLLASAGSKANITRARELIAAPMPAVDPPAAHDAEPDAATDHRPPKRTSAIAPMIGAGGWRPRHPADDKRGHRESRRQLAPPPPTPWRRCRARSPRHLLHSPIG